MNQEHATAEPLSQPPAITNPSADFRDELIRSLMREGIVLKAKIEESEIEGKTMSRERDTQSENE